MKKLILPPTMFSVLRHDFSRKGPGQVLLEIYTQVHDFLCLLEPILG